MTNRVSRTWRASVERGRQLARSHQQVVDKSGRADRPDAARNVVP